MQRRPPSVKWKGLSSPIVDEDRMSPPWRVTMRLPVATPMPVPSNSLEECGWQNGSNSRPDLVQVEAHAVVAHEITATAPFSSTMRCCRIGPGLKSRPMPQNPVPRA